MVGSLELNWFAMFLVWEFSTDVVDTTFLVRSGDETAITGCNIPDSNDFIMLSKHPT